MLRDRTAKLHDIAEVSGSSAVKYFGRSISLGPLAEPRSGDFSRILLHATIKHRLARSVQWEDKPDSCAPATRRSESHVKTSQLALVPS